MYDILTSNAQSVLSNEGVQTNNAGVVKFTSDNEGCVEFIDNSKTYRLNFTKNGQEFDLSSEVETIENIKSMTDADENGDATPSIESEEGTEKVVEEVSEPTELEEMKAMYESKMSEMETKIDSMMTDIEELKACMPKENAKNEEEPTAEPTEEPKEESTEEITNEKTEAETTEEPKEVAKEEAEEIDNTKTAKAYYGDYAEYIINNEKTFI